MARASAQPVGSRVAHWHLQLRQQVQSKTELAAASDSKQH